MLCITEKKKAPAPPQHLTTDRAACRLISNSFSDLQSALLILKSRTERKTNMNEELMNTPIDRWGAAWRRFMEMNYPDEILQLKANGRWDIIPRLIDLEAWQMWELLRRQYAEKNPRPKTFVEIAAWEKTRSLVVEHEVMEQVVLQERG